MRYFSCEDDLRVRPVLLGRGCQRHTDLKEWYLRYVPMTTETVTTATGQGRGGQKCQDKCLHRSSTEEEWLGGREG